MFAAIVLPAGKNRITIGEIPALFAEAIHPALGEVAKRQITALKKFALNKKNKVEWCGAGDGHAFPVPLTDLDIKALHKSVWHGMPRFNLPLLECVWEPYRAAFESAPPDDWRLEVTHINPNTQNFWASVTTENEYRRAIQKACIAGTLVPQDPLTLLPAPEAMGETLDSCFITVEALRHFAENMNVGVTTDDTKVTQAEPLKVASASGGVETDKAGQKGGLLTKEIAVTFDGVNGWNVERWSKNLSASKWLHPARIALGGAGGASSVWNPLTLAQLMHSKTKGDKARGLVMTAFNSRFTRNPALEPWRDDFNEYFATHCASD